VNIQFGLVTHPRTRYPDLYWEKYKKIAYSLEDSRVITKLSISVSSKNYINEEKIRLAKIIRGRWANLSLSISWYAYLNSDSIIRKIRKWVSASIDLIKFITRLILNKSFRINETKSYIRHQNISRSHQAVFLDAEMNDSDWALILEDDVCDRDFEVEILKVLRYIRERDFSKIDLFINLSDSLSYKQMGVSKIVIESKLNSDSSDFWMTTKTFHNTTAANLYNKRFISKFNSAFSEQINWCVERAIPFDWILNHLVLQEIGGEIKSIHMTTPIFRQLSINYGND
jgi:hypothetical protein